LTGRASFVWIGPQDPARRDALPDDLPHVRFVGERTDMPAVYSALDVFVLPSYREGLPRSAMEAAACGRPMVLTSVRGTREFQFYAVPALWVPSRRADSLALQLERLVRDPGLREALGNAAAEGAGRAFDQRRVAARSLGTYAQVRQRQLRATRGRRHGLSVSPRR
jgi:glycosyltransferase involved in cell wall biosynthesis